MKVLFYRIIFLVVFVLLQFSFFDIIFPWFRAPIFLLDAVVICTLLRGFPRVLFLSLPLTLLFDTVSGGAVTWFSLYALAFAYGTSFLSRRLLIEHRGLGLLLYAIVSYGGVLLYQAGFFLLVHGWGVTNTAILDGAFPSGEGLLFSFVASLPIFIVTYFVVKHFEEHLDFINQKQFLNIR